MGAGKTDNLHGSTAIPAPLRVLVTVGAAYRELLQELHQFPSNTRAQRLLLLAALGHQSLQSGGFGARRSVIETGVIAQPSEVGEDNDARLQALLNGFRGAEME